MPTETELIQQQMGQTRAALSEKLETLENKVLVTVSTTTDTVAQTVNEVGTTVRETTQDVRTIVHETLTSVRDAFDVSRQVDRHPWLMMCGSVIAGYVGGLLLDRLERGRMPSLPSLPRAEGLLPQDAEVRRRLDSDQPARRAPAFLMALADTFAPEVEKLKSAAVGLALGAFRDRLHESVPPNMREDFVQMMDRITAKLGGEPYPVGTMSSSSEKHEEANGAGEPRRMGMG